MGRIAALILAAGYSSRMGRFKPLMPLGEKLVIEWATDTFRTAGIPDIWVVTGHAANTLTPTLQTLDISSAYNPDYAKGMYSSICTGVASLPQDVTACFVLPVDIPLVRPATITAMLTRQREYPANVIYPSFSGQRGHPPLIRRALFAEILAYDGEGGLHALLQRHEAAALAVADEAILLDMDTPQAYAQLTERCRYRHVPNPTECEAMLDLCGTCDAVRRHGRAVASIACALGQHLDEIDLPLLNAASLLHDIAKAHPHHAQAGADQLTQFGYPLVAQIVRPHMDLDFQQAQLDAAALLYLADKLVCEDRRVSLEARFQPAFNRFGAHPEALAGAQRRYHTACLICNALEQRLGVRLETILADCEVLL